MGNIFISVIIIAYNRKKYILDAIKSVMNQTLNKRYYEIIIIKNYNDNEIDDFINKNNIKNIFSNDNSLSGKIYDALKIANGNVVSFLEDDDLFTSNKLEIVFNLFKNENVCYYHNASESIDEFGYSLNTKNTNPDFNLSSISIRKDIIYRDIIKEILKAVDTTLYFNALDSGKEIVIGYEVLTYYRVHISETHLTGTLENIASSNLNMTKLYVVSFEILYKRLINKNSRNKLMLYIIGFKLNANLLSRYLKKNNIYFIGNEDIKFWLFYNNEKFLYGIKSFFHKISMLILLSMPSFIIKYAIKLTINK